MAKKNLPPWLQPKPKPHPMRIGVTWYTAEQWLLVKAASTDAERFEETYEDWVAMAEEATKNMLATGIVSERVQVVASELLAWCLAHGKKNDAASRSEFVSHVLSRRNESDA
jgi:histidine ammonia-lyase